MSKARSRTATAEWRIVSVAIVSAFVASCSPTADPTLDFSNPSLAAAEAMRGMPSTTAAATASGTETRRRCDDVERQHGALAAIRRLCAGGQACRRLRGAARRRRQRATTRWPVLRRQIDSFNPSGSAAAASDAQAQSAAAADCCIRRPLPADNPARPRRRLDNPVYVTATDPAAVALAPAPKKTELLRHRLCRHATRPLPGRCHPKNPSRLPLFGRHLDRQRARWRRAADEPKPVIQLAVGTAEAGRSEDGVAEPEATANAQPAARRAPDRAVRDQAQVRPRRRQRRRPA